VGADASGINEAEEASIAPDVGIIGAEDCVTADVGIIEEVSVTAGVGIKGAEDCVTADVGIIEGVSVTADVGIIGAEGASVAPDIAVIGAEGASVAPDIAVIGAEDCVAPDVGIVEDAEDILNGNPARPAFPVAFSSATHNCVAYCASVIGERFAALAVADARNCSTLCPAYAPYATKTASICAGVIDASIARFAASCSGIKDICNAGGKELGVPRISNSISSVFIVMRCCSGVIPAAEAACNFILICSIVSGDACVITPDVGITEGAADEGAVITVISGPENWAPLVYSGTFTVLEDIPIFN
jgi:hypothetical protein